VIAGPTLNIDGAAWTTTGIGFSALDNSHLTSFVYQNQGAADTIVLTDAAGNVLDSLSTPAGDTSYTASVNWALTAGDSYFLLQTVVSNELYASYGAPLPSNSDIAITLSGTFDYSIAGAVANSQNWGSNEYWAAFNKITTSSIPEPSTWAMMMLGFAGLGYAAVRRSSKSRLVASAA
jgi:PEP-CTERM motif